MDGSVGAGLVTVFAVSGSVVLLSLQVHKRLLSDFMKKLDFELGCEKDPPKKKVRFAENVVQLSSDTQKDRGVKNNNKVVPRQELKESMAMPLNWQVLYKGIIEYRISMQSSNFT